MRRLVLAAVLLLAACSRGGPAQALLGTWRGDREATLAKADACRCADERQRAWIEQQFPALEIEYTADRMSARLGTMVDAGPYEVVATGGDWLELRRTDLDRDAPVHRVVIEGERMTVSVAHLPFEQVFRRVK